MSPHEVRKQLLIAESELNRAQLVRDMALLTAEVRGLAARASVFSTVLSSAKLVVAALEASHPGTSATAEGNPGWWQGLRKGMAVVRDLWHVFRS